MDQTAIGATVATILTALLGAFGVVWREWRKCDERLDTELREAAQRLHDQVRVNDRALWTVEIKDNRIKDLEDRLREHRESRSGNRRGQP